MSYVYVLHNIKVHYFIMECQIIFAYIVRLKLSVYAEKNEIALTSKFLCERVTKRLRIPGLTFVFSALSKRSTKSAEMYTSSHSLCFIRIWFHTIISVTCAVCIFRLLFPFPVLIFKYYSCFMWILRLLFLFQVGIFKLSP